MSRYKKTDPKPTIAVLKQQTTHNSTVEQGLSKTRTIQEMVDDEAFKLFPDKAMWRKRLCYSLYEWGELDESLDITQFCREYRLPRQTLYDCIKQYPEVKKCFDEVKLWIGSRRRVGHIKRYYSDGVYKDMYKYDPEWLEIDKYNQTLKGDSDQGQVINVYLPEIKKSDEVPMLEEQGIQPELEAKGVEDANI